MLPATHTVGGYRASMDGDVLTIHRVPIFCACEKENRAGEVTQFDDRWIKAAVTNAMDQQRDNYHPPLHIRHHGDTDSVKAGGYFTITVAAPITFKGTRRTAIFADLIITDPSVQTEVLAGRLPYRSVEIFDVDNPSIDSLALLDHEAPFLELPMLMVTSAGEQLPTRAGLKVQGNEDPDSESMFPVVASATFGMTYERAAGDAVVGSFRRGRHAFQLFRAENEMSTATPTVDVIQVPATGVATAEPFGAGVVAPAAAFTSDNGDDDKPKKDEELEGAEDNGGVDSIVKAIESGSISVAAMDKIIAAIQSQRTEAAPEEETPAPAAAPGAEAMKKIPDEALSAQFAKMQGTIDALTANGVARDAAAQRTIDVQGADKRLEGRPGGHDRKAKLTKYHEDFGPAAFKAYVDSLAETFGILPGGSGAAEAFIGQGGEVPQVAMAYQAQGVTAMDQAAGFARDYDELKAHGMPVRMTQKRHVELSMTRVANKEN